MPFRKTRVFRFDDPVTGTGQIAAFPETPPAVPDVLLNESQQVRDEAVRMLHFTEVENFGFLGYVLAHEIGAEDLGDQLLDIAINWEHAVANNVHRLVPGDPLRVDVPALQKLIDDLDAESERLVTEINVRSRDYAVKRFEQTREATRGG